MGFVFPNQSASAIFLFTSLCAFLFCIIATLVRTLTTEIGIVILIYLHEEMDMN